MVAKVRALLRGEAQRGAIITAKRDAYHIIAAAGDDDYTGTMIVIWGSKNKQRLLSTGRFFCPGCRRNAEYSLMQVSRYFTLYFMPLFRTGTVGEFVQCHGCGGSFAPEAMHATAEVLDETPREPWVCGVCRNHNPPDSQTCARCNRWACPNCGKDNPVDIAECLRCRGRRGAVPGRR